MISRGKSAKLLNTNELPQVSTSVIFTHIEKPIILLRNNKLNDTHTAHRESHTTDRIETMMMKTTTLTKIVSNTTTLQNLALWSRTLFCLLVLSFSPLFTYAATPNQTSTLVDEIEVVRRNQQLFLYLHSNAPITHQSLETSATHLTVALEQVKLSAGLRTNYLNAPNINSIIVKQLPNHTIRLEIDGTDLNEPIVGFRELSGQVIPTVEKVGAITLNNANNPTIIPTNNPSISHNTSYPNNNTLISNSNTTTQLPAVATNSTTVGVNNNASATVANTHNASKQPAASTGNAKSSLPIATTSPKASTKSIAIGTTALQESTTADEGEETPSGWEALFLRIIMFATRHIDWCLYALGGTILLSVLIALGLRRKSTIPVNTTNTAANQAVNPTLTPYGQATNNVSTFNGIGIAQAPQPKTIAFKETLPPTHQRILDRVQRQMDGTAPSIPNTTAFKSVPSMPVSQASKQYQQQQNFNTVKPAKTPTPMNAPNLKRNEPATTSATGQKVVRPWQPERLAEPTETTPLPASGEAFLQSMSNFLDPESKKNIQQGLLNKRSL